VKLYEITVEPISPLGTPLKGDTIFGHFCWQSSDDPSLVHGGLAEQLRHYDERPFAVFSSAFPKVAGPGGTSSYAVKRPDMPLDMLSVFSQGKLSADVLKIKEQKKRRWMLVPGDLGLDAKRMAFLADEELGSHIRDSLPDETRRKTAGFGPARLSARFTQSHNTINRLTFTTGTAPFAPYTQEAASYCPGVKLAIFAAIDESSTDINKIRIALERIGNWGFGKDASIGYGRFIVAGCTEIETPSCNGANAMYMLGPCVPQQGSFDDAFFVPFVRFGKHGGDLARCANPFKNPVIMADEGAVFTFKDHGAFVRPYFGRSVKSVSKTQPEAVAQGYSLYLPFRLER
jgi:CRISPR-associated protein Csm4